MHLKMEECICVKLLVWRLSQDKQHFESCLFEGKFEFKFFSSTEEGGGGMFKKGFKLMRVLYSEGVFETYCPVTKYRQWTHNQCGTVFIIWLRFVAVTSNCTNAMFASRQPWCNLVKVIFSINANWQWWFFRFGNFFLLFQFLLFNCFAVNKIK